MLSKGLEKASCSALTDDESATLKEVIHKTPDIALEIIEPDIQSISGTIESNPTIFRDSILPLLLSSPLREE
jgi:SOS-response transcriptional repressor LexA